MLTAAQVREVQAYLTDKGFDPGGIDGDFGPRTQLAVYAFLLGVPAAMPKDEGAVQALLDAIGSKEAPEGYNQVYSGAVKFVGRPKLTEMSLDAIRALQERMKASGSTAVGRYQFIRKTFDATRKAMGLRGEALWSPELQDLMALYLLHQRGLGEYRAGRLSREGFANNIAKEWASLPVVTAIRGQHRDLEPGQSFYAGDGLNKSHHKPEAILALIDAIKQTPPRDGLTQPRKEPTMAKELDVAKFLRVYEENLPVSVERANAGMEKTFAKSGASMGMAAPQALVALPVGSFCDNWPNIRKAINQALKWSWLLPSSIRQYVPQVKAFLAAANATFIPMVCGASAAAEENEE